MPSLSADLPALFALAALLLLPGLAVVAAPWPVAPFLSLAFWLGSWSWLLALGGSRETFLRLALVSFAALAGLRLLKPLPFTRLSAGSALVLALGLLALGSFRALPLATHAEAPGQAVLARLLVARDGWPVTRAPFEPARPFTGVDGVALMAADVALLTDAPVWRATLMAGLAAPGLLAVALVFLVRRVRPAAHAGAPAALLLGLVALGLHWFDPGLVLSTACAVVGLGLLARGTTRAPAVAAGACLAASVVFHVAMGGLAVFAVLPVVVSGLGRPEAARGPALRARLIVLALAFSAFLGPALGRLAPGTWPWGAAACLALGGLAAFQIATAAQAHPRILLGVAALLAALGLAVGLFQARAAQSIDGASLQVLSCLRDKGAPADTLCVPSAELLAWAPSLSDHAVRLEPPAQSCRFRYAPSGTPARPPACLGGTVQIVEEP